MLARWKECVVPNVVVTNSVAMVRNGLRGMGFVLKFSNSSVKIVAE